MAAVSSVAPFLLAPNHSTYTEAWTPNPNLTAPGPEKIWDEDGAATGELKVSVTPEAIFRTAPADKDTGLLRGGR